MKFLNIFVRRFWAKVDQKTKSECWDWTGSRNADGYGMIGFNGSLIKAHRASWSMANNKTIPENMFVCHKCDNPSCVNPEHLFLGTNQENVNDRNKKGRQAKGEKNGRSKLSNQKVKEIRKRHTPYCSIDGTLALAKEFGVGETTIRNVLTGLRWKDV